MDYKAIRLTGFAALIASASAVLGSAALTFGPWAHASSDGMRTLLMVSFLAFSMLGTVANSAARILESQADQISELKRQLAERPAA